VALTAADLPLAVFSCRHLLAAEPSGQLPGIPCQLNLWQLYGQCVRELACQTFGGWLPWLDAQIQDALQVSDISALARWVLFYLSESWDCTVLADAMRALLYLQAPELAILAAKLGRLLYPTEALFQTVWEVSERTQKMQLRHEAYWHYLLTPALTQPRLSVCMVVRNAADTLPAALQSVAALADEYVIAETGSADGTWELIQAWSQHHAVQAFQLDWREHFAWARNQVLQRAQGDWLLFLDADEVLKPESIDVLQAVLAYRPVGPQVLAVSCESLHDQPENNTQDWLLRLLPRHPWIRFWGSLHERPGHVYLAERLPVQPLNSVQLMHSGYVAAAVQRHQKKQRNRFLSENLTVQGLANPYFLYHQAYALLFQQLPPDVQQAELLLQQSLLETARYQAHPPVPGWFEAPVAYVQVLLFALWARQARWEQIRSHYQLWQEPGNALIPDPELHYWQGVACLQQAAFSAAQLAFERALRLGDRLRPQAGFGSWKAYAQLTQLALLSQNWELGIGAWMALLASKTHWQTAYAQWWVQMLQAESKGASRISRA